MLDDSQLLCLDSVSFSLWFICEDRKNYEPEHGTNG